jgi:hypothetical protein
MCTDYFYHFGMLKQLPKLLRQKSHKKFAAQFENITHKVDASEIYLASLK